MPTIKSAEKARGALWRSFRSQQKKLDISLEAGETFANVSAIIETFDVIVEDCITANDQLVKTADPDSVIIGEAKRWVDNLQVIAVVSRNHAMEYLKRKCNLAS